MRICVFAVLSLLLLAPMTSMAGNVELEVVRAGADLYEIVGKDLFVETEYCFEGLDKSKVVLHLEEEQDYLVFSDTGARCDVLMVFGRSGMDPGNYQINIDWKHDDWFAFTDQDAAFKTSGCYSLVENAEARVTIDEQGTGTLVISSADEECTIEGIYAKTELTIEEKVEEKK